MEIELYLLLTNLYHYISKMTQKVSLHAQLWVIFGISMIKIFHFLADHVIFDNSFSWIRQKRLKYKVELEEMPSSIDFSQ